MQRVEKNLLFVGSLIVVYFIALLTKVIILCQIFRLYSIILEHRMIFRNRKKRQSLKDNMIWMLQWRTRFVISMTFLLMYIFRLHFLCCLFQVETCFRKLLIIVIVYLISCFQGLDEDTGPQVRKLYAEVPLAPKTKNYSLYCCLAAIDMLQSCFDGSSL